MSLRGVVAWLVAGMLLLSASALAAAPTAQDKAQAKAAWMKGKRLQAQGRHDDAAAALREAVEKEPRAQYQLDLARSLAKSGALLEARANATAVVETREPNVQMAKQAAAALKKEIELKIPSIRVDVTGAKATEAKAWIDGNAVQIGAEVELDPGTHEVKARAGDAPELTKQVELAEGQKETVTFALEASVEEKKPDVKSRGGGNMAPAAVLYGVGGAGLVVGAVLGVLAFNKTSEVQELCGGNVCPPQYADDVALAQDYGTGSTVAFAIGGLCVAAGIILTVTVGIDGGDDEEEETKAFVAPYLGPTGAGLHGRF